MLETSAYLKEGTHTAFISYRNRGWETFKSYHLRRSWNNPRFRRSLDERDKEEPETDVSQTASSLQAQSSSPGRVSVTRANVDSNVIVTRSG